MPRASIVAMILTALAVSCRPDFGERESLVDRARVLAVRIEPPEAKPGEPVVTSLLVASPDGPVDAPVAAAWAFCATPKLLTENGSVSAACLADGVLPIGTTRGGTTAALPPNACFEFGPETQSAEVRPRDADVTGGYFVPIRARIELLGGSEPLTTFGFARIACNLPGASAELTKRFAAEYQRNKSPTLLPIGARFESGMAADLASIPRGARVVLEAAWRAEDAERYAVFDASAQQIVMRRESMRLSWFTTAGALDRDRTGRTEEELETSTSNVWAAPDEARTTHLWFVLRDARGGTTFASVTATTR